MKRKTPWTPPQWGQEGGDEGVKPEQPIAVAPRTKSAKSVATELTAQIDNFTLDDWVKIARAIVLLCEVGKLKISAIGPKIRVDQRFAREMKEASEKSLLPRPPFRDGMRTFLEVFGVSFEELFLVETEEEAEKLLRQIEDRKPGLLNSLRKTRAW